MRCKNCDFALWNLRARTCSECSSPFKPSDFEFTPNAVRFCCPHCNQDYYGLTAQGHLDPSEFTCVKCQQFVHMDDMIILPTEGVREEQTERHRQPWLERGVERVNRRGFFSALFATIGYALVKPGRLLEATPPTGGVGSATSFALIIAVVFGLVTGVFMLMFFGLTMGAVFGAAGGGGGRPTMPALGSFVFGTGVGTFVACTVGVVVLLLVNTVAAHVMLKITGGTAFGIGRTWQAMCYASGANTVSLVPCLGGYFGWIWWLVSSIVALRSAQRVHGFRATLAVLTLPMLLLTVVLGVYGWLIWTAFGGGFTPPAPQIIVTSADRTRFKALTVSINNQHIAAALDRGIDWSDFWLSASSQLDESTIDGLTSYDWKIALPVRREEAIKNATASLEGKVAYRLGDMVFTHLGVLEKAAPNGNVANADAGELWLVVAWPLEFVTMPDEDSVDTGVVPSALSKLLVGTADRKTIEIPYGLLEARLNSQNQLRAKYGLKPLPHPKDVLPNQVSDAPPPQVPDLRDVPQPETTPPSAAPGG